MIDILTMSNLDKSVWTYLLLRGYAYVHYAKD